MITVLGEQYYVDLNSLENTINFKPESGPEGEIHINVAKYEIIKMMIEIIMSESEEADENLGTHNLKKLSIPFKIAFNTLLQNQILKHY
jgi:hypothetical protein